MGQLHNRPDRPHIPSYTSRVLRAHRARPETWERARRRTALSGRCKICPAERRLRVGSSGWLERTPDKREVGGSSPPRPTRFMDVLGSWVS